MGMIEDAQKQEEESFRKLQWIDRRIDSVFGEHIREVNPPNSSKCTSIDRFHSTPNSQTSSPLLQLPTELQLKILRFLLVNGYPIATYKAYYEKHNALDDVAKRSDWLSLSSQILRCCQVLYQNGTSILYQENTITVDVCSMGGLNSKHTYYLAVLDEYTGFPELPLPESRPGPKSIPDDWTPSFWLGKSLYPVLDILKVLSSTTCQTLLRFQNILLTTESVESRKWRTSDNISELSLACLLRDYVAAKNVTVSIYPQRIDPHEWSQTIKAFEVWRCKSIEFLDMDQDNSLIIDQQTKQTQQVITGATPVDEDYEIIIEVFNILIQLNDFYRGYGARDCFGMFQEWDDVQAAVLERDGQKFRKSTKSLLERALVGSDEYDGAVMMKLMKILEGGTDQGSDR